MRRRTKYSGGNLKLTFAVGGESKMKLRTKNKFLKVIILFLLIVLLLDKIKDAFSIFIIER